MNVKCAPRWSNLKVQYQYCSLHWNKFIWYWYQSINAFWLIKNIWFWSQHWDKDICILNIQIVRSVNDWIFYQTNSHNFIYSNCYTDCDQCRAGDITGGVRDSDFVERGKRRKRRGHLLLVCPVRDQSNTSTINVSQYYFIGWFKY